ncbi:MAG: hypothetical protein JSS02_02205 [Planctomycetes bacterium]|nr:hypothetical protein [Planctomycetota bacterium]
MQFVGKILVVLLLVLSILFLSFAAVVYNTHMSWRKVAEDQKKLVEKANKEKNDLAGEFDRFKNELNAKMKEIENRAGEIDATNKGLQAELAQAKKARDENAIAQKASAELAEILGQEAEARRSEADVLRQLNHNQAGKLNENIETITKLEDELHNSNQALGVANVKNKDLIGKVSILQQALEANGINADPTELAARVSPPPRVDGIILDSRPPKRQGASELVEISLGSDQGLKKGHELSIFRTGAKGGPQPKFLGKIVIVKTEPDKAVGQVIEASRNGVIQKGDNVTTKL